MSLPIDRASRKGIPLYKGMLQYFPDALAGVAIQSVKGSNEHLNGGGVTHDRSKSVDDGDALLRHLSDLAAKVAHYERALIRDPDMGCCARDLYIRDILSEANAIAWRALALSQKLYEQYGGQPLAPGAQEST